MLIKKKIKSCGILVLGGTGRNKGEEQFFQKSVGKSLKAERLPNSCETGQS